MIEHVGIIYTKRDVDSLEATMLVDQRTVELFGLLHHGASVVLAEILCSAAGYLCCEGEAQVVGIDINANHFVGISSGYI